MRSICIEQFGKHLSELRDQTSKQIDCFHGSLFMNMDISIEIE